MLLAVIPKLATVAVLTDPANLAHTAFLKNARTAAQTKNVRVVSAEARTLSEISNAFALMSREKAAAVIVTLAPLFVQQGRVVAELATKHKLPSISANRGYADSGGLMSYGQNQAESYRRAATYVDKIFKGAYPGNLPVEQPTKFELVVNSKAAKAIGLTIPRELLLRAEEVIE